jgi:DNA-directed RNA polymerase specialized sigma24 family protein
MMSDPLDHRTAADRWVRGQCPVVWTIMRSFAHKIPREHEEEVEADAYLALARIAAAFDLEAASPDHYATAAIKNVILDSLRHRKLQRTHEEPLPDPIDHADDENLTMPDPCDLNMIARDHQKFLRRLKPEIRAAFLLQPIDRKGFMRKEQAKAQLQAMWRKSII